MKKFLLICFFIFNCMLIVYADTSNAGIGVILKEENNKIIIDEILSNSPAELKGLKTKDIILEIDGVSTENLQLEEVRSKIIGEKNSKVSIKILRNEEINKFGFKTCISKPQVFEILRNYDFSAVPQVEVFKDGNDYYLKLTDKGNKYLCKVIYERDGINYFRKIRCEKDNNNTYDGRYGTNVKLPVETWKDWDILFFNKYGEYSIWHDNPDPNIKSDKELQFVKINEKKDNLVKLLNNQKYTELLIVTNEYIKNQTIADDEVMMTLIYTYRGIARYNLDDYVEGANEFEKSAKIIPNYYAFLGLGNCALGAKVYDIALKWFTLSISYNKDNPEAFEGKAYACLGLKKYKEYYQNLEYAKEQYLRRGDNVKYKQMLERLKK